MDRITAATAPVSDPVRDAVHVFGGALDQYCVRSVHEDDDAWAGLVDARDSLREVAIEHVETERDIEPELFAEVRRWLQADDEQSACFHLLHIAEERGLPDGDIRRICEDVEADISEAEEGFMRRWRSERLN